MARTDVWFEGNSMLVRLLGLTDESDGSKVTGGVTVQAKVYDEDGELRETLTLAHQSDGDWQASSSTDDVDPHITPGDQIEVVWTVDGGTPESQATWTARPTVRERAA